MTTTNSPYFPKNTSRETIEKVIESSFNKMNDVSINLLTEIENQTNKEN